MRKTLFLIVVLCLIAVPTIFAQSYTANLGRFNLQFFDNFQWGRDYQGKIEQRNLVNGHQIRAGETWTLTIKFTLSRDLEESLNVVFVDTTEAARPNAYWEELSPWVLLEAPDGGILRAGVEYSYTVTFTTIKAATGAQPAANALVFSTEGQGRPGTANSGVRRPPTMRFTEFVLTRQ